MHIAASGSFECAISIYTPKASGPIGQVHGQVFNGSVPWRYGGPNTLLLP